MNNLEMVDRYNRRESQQIAFELQRNDGMDLLRRLEENSSNKY